MAADPVRCADGPSDRAVGARTSALFEQHGRMVYGLCRWLLRDPFEAEDATQATFVSAYRSLLGGGSVREPAAWLATIARNECRARAHARMREPLPLLEDDLSHAHGPHEEVDRRMLASEIRTAISELPDKQREAVVLRDLYGMRYDEVGAALGVSRASVESLLFRARRQLRVRLKPLAGGALAVPLAVREGIAQALPGFATGTAGGGALAVASAGAGGGLLAKVAATPVAAKVAGALVALGTAGSVGVVGVEHAERHPSPATRVPAAASAPAPRPAGRASEVSLPTLPVSAETELARSARSVVRASEDASEKTTTSRSEDGRSGGVDESHHGSDRPEPEQARVDPGAETNVSDRERERRKSEKGGDPSSSEVSDVSEPGAPVEAQQAEPDRSGDASTSSSGTSASDGKEPDTSGDEPKPPETPEPPG